MVAKFVKLFDHLQIKANAPLEDLLRFLVEEIGYEAYLEKSAVADQDVSPMANVDELITAAVEFDRQHPEDGSLEAFLEQVALVSDTDAFQDASERVTLMTLHAAKGLEFTRVFIIGVEDDLLPHKRSRESEWEIEEERRLLFVGITRAKEGLQLSCCKRRSVRGELRPVIPSPFLHELPLDEMRRVESSFEQDWFDEDYDQSYPDSWDLPDEDSGFVREAPDREAVTVDQERFPQLASGGALAAGRAAAGEPHPDPDQGPTAAQGSAKSPSGLRTAAEMLAGAATPLSAYQEGTKVRHPEYGEGTIVAVGGRGPKRIARVQFEDGEHRFRLAFVDLEVVSP
jgi:DNA helicase-2/ATP-dependent DNA helicase PcrA